MNFFKNYICKDVIVAKKIVKPELRKSSASCRNFQPETPESLIAIHAFDTSSEVNGGVW